MGSRQWHINERIKKFLIEVESQRLGKGFHTIPLWVVETSNSIKENMTTMPTRMQNDAFMLALF